MERTFSTLKLFTGDEWFANRPQKKLRHYLQINPGWHTSRELTLTLGVSHRSIKRYAKDLTNKKKVNLYDLTDKYFRSKNSLIKILQNVANYVDQFDLTLTHHGGFYALRGSEIVDFRYCLSRI
ncbi:helix-turn-helix domain-containing protein [Lactobacillus sp. DCY120]|uniref:Helix-turn-helix domain-containing protein n=1 Tax=Bombilactobacillus apium TaxID=2675299 RepID=A0A850QWH6_9LACO|nr:helix-turn-helix domain-containing protein [Bombilactobacillus apium]NVY96154.1 helix-turn-helix domain-containing protein [Bombilactobacillus apium]